MATFIASTSSNWPSVEPDSVEQLREIIDEYEFPGTMGSLKVTVHDGTTGHGSEDDPYLKVLGEASFDPTKPIYEDDSVVDREHGFAEEFLERIAPHLEEKLVIRTIGHEKLRFPFLATQWAVWPDGTTRQDSFEQNPDKPVGAD